MKEKTKKILRAINPFSLKAVKDIVVTPFTSQLETTRHVVKEVAQGLNPVGAYDRAKAKSRHETYEEAVARLGVTPESEAKNLRMYKLMCGLTLFCGIGCIIGSIVFFSLGKLANGFPMLAFSTVHFALWNRYSFAVHQITNRRLCTGEEFLKLKLGKFSKLLDILYK